MAVAHSAASESHAATTGSVSQTSFSWTHTQTGTPQGVLVFVHVTNSATDTVTNVTYGSVTLTRVSGGAAVDTAGEQIRCDLFFAGSGLGTGNQTITVTRTNNTNILYATAATVTAATNTNVTGIVLLQGDGPLGDQYVDDGSPGTNSVRYAAATSGLNAPPTVSAFNTLLHSIDVGNQSAALARETTAGQGARLVGFTTASDDRAAIHVAVRELFNRSITGATGAFALTGNDATLTKANPKQITAETGAFALTGQPADLLHNPDIEAGTGAFTLTGQPAEARHNVRIEAGTGAFSFTGNDATLTEATPKAITADTGTFTLTGNPAAVTRGYALTPEAGTFTAAGQPATLLHNPRIEANTGSFVLSGGAPALLRGHYLSGGAGEFIETGQPATFRRTWAVQAATGAFALTGQQATTAVGVTLAGETGKFFLPERNLHQRSEEFNNAYWTKTNSSVTTNSTTAPDGTLTAETLIENTTNTTHIISRNLAFKTGVKYTASLYVKTYQNRDVGLLLGTTAVFGGTGNTVIIFSPSTNTILLTQNSPESFGAIDVGSGWYRIYLTKTAIASATVSGQIQLRIGSTNTYTGDGTSGAYIWGAQWEEGDLSSYDPTSANSAPLTNLRVTHRLAADTGAFSFTGNPAALTELGAYEIDPIVGTFVLSGQSASLAQSQSLSANTGTYALTGNPAALQQNYRLEAATGTYALTGNPAALTLEAAPELSTLPGAFSLSGQPASFAAARLLPAATGTFSFTGNPATLTLGGAPVFAVTTGTYTLTGQPAAFNLVDVYALEAAPASFTLTGAAATFTYVQRRRVILIF